MAANSPNFSAILPAAGLSTRFGGPTGKLWQPLRGKPVLYWSLLAFAGRDDVTEVVVACGDAAGVRRCAADLPPAAAAKITICPGGDCRAGSVAAAARTARGEWIAVHDAARPLVSAELIERTVLAAMQHGAAAPALPVHLTIKQADGPLPAMVQRTVPRHQLWAMQTPQVMRRADLLDAVARCPIPLSEVTDDVQLLELMGKPVWLVPGEAENIKITTPMDLRLAEIMESEKTLR